MAEGGDPLIGDIQDFPKLGVNYYIRRKIEEALRDPLVLDQTRYLIDSKWFRSFKRFVGFDGVNHEALDPGPIDNSLLLDNSLTKLKSGLVETLDYVIVSPVVWSLLYEWYGLKEDQAPIERKVVNVARSPKQELKVEVYKVLLKLSNAASLANCFVKEFSCSNTISDVEEYCRKIFKVLDTTKIRLKCYYSNKRYQILCSDSLIYEESLDSNVYIVMETVLDLPEESKKGFTKPLPKSKEVSRIPRAIPSTSKGSTGSGMMTRQGAAEAGLMNTARGQGPPRNPGQCGLVNLGNTCFLNSIVQCLSNCEPISVYFQEGKHTSEINATNPFGNLGAIANTFADVIAMIWSGKYSITVPHNFKLQLTNFAPQFAGSEQHDAQELLTFLLDGLHEDLNRVTEKPYIPSPENGEEEDDELAKKSWENFKKRNDSVIIDNFHGMLKSRVVCPKCEKVSVKFDTFSTLSVHLPLPVRNDRLLIVRFIPYDQSSDEMKLRVKVTKTGTVYDLLSEISNIVATSPENLILTEVERHHFHKFFSCDDLLETIVDSDELVVYDLPDETNDVFNTWTVLPVVLWEINESNPNAQSRSNLFGTPFLLHLPRGKILFSTLYDEICERMVRNCKHFMNVNSRNRNDCISMDCDDNDSRLFRPVMLNIDRSGVAIIDVNEEDTFEVSDHFGRDILALQIPRRVRRAYYTENLPLNFHPNTRFAKDTNHDKVITLEDCLNLFITTEKLGENNAWHCPHCATMQKATKKLDLWKLPNILIFHLKRFVFNETRREKLSSKVVYPMHGLSIDHLVVNNHKDNLVYDLIGVCNHNGSLICGHYTAYCKNFRDGNWYSFDDTTVEQISPERVQSEHAYVLFYQRRPAQNEDNVAC